MCVCVCVPNIYIYIYMSQKYSKIVTTLTFYGLTPFNATPRSGSAKRGISVWARRCSS